MWLGKPYPPSPLPLLPLPLSPPSPFLSPSLSLSLSPLPLSLSPSLPPTPSLSPSLPPTPSLPLPPSPPPSPPLPPLPLKSPQVLSLNFFSKTLFPKVWVAKLRVWLNWKCSTSASVCCVPCSFINYGLLWCFSSLVYRCLCSVLPPGSIIST